MYKDVCIHVYARIHTCICMYMQVYACIHTCICMWCISTWTYRGSPLLALLLFNIANTCASMNINIHTWIRINIHVYACICMYTYIYMHVCICTCRHRCSPLRALLLCNIAGTCTYMNMNIHTWICINMHVYACMHMYVWLYAIILSDTAT